MKPGSLTAIRDKLTASNQNSEMQSLNYFCGFSRADQFLWDYSRICEVSLGFLGPKRTISL